MRVPYPRSPNLFYFIFRNTANHWVLVLRNSLTFGQKYETITHTMAEDSVSTEGQTPWDWEDSLIRKEDWELFEKSGYCSSIKEDGKCVYCDKEFPITEKHIITWLHTACVHEFR